MHQFRKAFRMCLVAFLIATPRMHSIMFLKIILQSSYSLLKRFQTILISVIYVVSEYVQWVNSISEYKL